MSISENSIKIKRAIKKHQLIKLLPGIPDGLFRETCWQVMSEFRKKPIEEVKRIQIVLPREVEEIKKQLQYD